MAKVPPWAADPYYEKLLAREVTGGLAMQDSDDPFVQLSAYKVAVFSAWDKYQKQTLGDSEIESEKPEHFQYCLVRARRALNGRGDVELDNILAASPKLREVAYRTIKAPASQLRELRKNK